MIEWLIIASVLFIALTIGILLAVRSAPHCARGTQWDVLLKKCAPICDADQQYDPVKNVCQCMQGKIWDANAKKCVPPQPTGPTQPPPPTQWKCVDTSFGCVSSPDGSFASQDECEKQCSTCQACYMNNMKCISAPSVYDWKRDKTLQANCCPDQRDDQGCDRPIYDPVRGTCKQTCRTDPFGWSEHTQNVSEKRSIP